MKTTRLSLIIVIVIIALASFALAHGPSTSKGQMSERFWETYGQLPQTSMKMDYLAHNLVLPNFGYIILSFAAITAVIVFLFRNHYLPHGKVAWGPILTLLVFFAVILGLIYSVFIFYAEGGESGIVVCKSDSDCVISMHIHAEIEAELCGEKIGFPLEAGELSSAHTHKEKGLIHWHDTEPVDPKTKSITNPDELTIGSFFQQMGMNFKDGCINGYCDGMACNGKGARVVMLVNGNPSSELDKYVWKDGDKISVVFG